MARESRGAAKIQVRPFAWAGTLLKVMIGMTVIAACGFFLGRDFIADQYLPESEVRTDRPQPIRVLTPDEAAAMAKETPSHVWTQGVKDEDIPKLKHDESRSSRPSGRQRSTRPERETGTPAEDAEAAPTVDEDDAAGADADDARYRAADSNRPDNPPAAEAGNNSENDAAESGNTERSTEPRAAGSASRNNGTDSSPRTDRTPSRTRPTPPPATTPEGGDEDTPLD